MLFLSRGVTLLDPTRATTHCGSDSDADAQHCQVLSLCNTRQCRRSTPACLSSFSSKVNIEEESGSSALIQFLQILVIVQCQ